tara:strand:- start:614 stop:916 length:303 start_codon:yes stop_codon:yes gene_type:complete
MIKKELSTGRKVEIKEMSIDDMDFCLDIPTLEYKDGVAVAIKNANKARTAWIRKGLAGGDFKNWKAKGATPSDSVIKELTDLEKDELRLLIQECQHLGEG